MNECRDILRAQRRHVALESVLAVADEHRDVQLGARLRRLVANLPPQQRSVLALRVFTDLQFAEIARPEGITENSAKVSFHHAVRRLQRWLGRPV